MPDIVTLDLTCTGQSTISPFTTKVEGVANPEKLQAVSVSAGQTATIQITMKAPDGNPINLSGCAAGTTAKLKIIENLTALSDVAPTTIDGTITTPASGLVSFTLTAEVVKYPGISFAEAGIVDADGNLLFSNIFYVVVNRGLWANEICDMGPLSVAEIRLHMRDNSPEDNLWRGIEEFDLAEIAACISRPVMYFNEANPPITQKYNTASFPWRYNWLNGTLSQLYSIAAAHYRRVHLPYQAGGLAVDDKNKAQEYQQMADRLWAEYKQWVQMKKVELNAKAAFGILGSPYSGS